MKVKCVAGLFYVAELLLCCWFLLFLKCCNVYFQLREWTQSFLLLNLISICLPQFILNTSTSVSLVLLLFSFLDEHPCSCPDLVLTTEVVMLSGHAMLSHPCGKHTVCNPNPHPSCAHFPPPPLWCEVTAGEPYDLTDKCLREGVCDGRGLLCSSLPVIEGAGCHDSSC